MSHPMSVAASLSPAARKTLAIEVLSKNQSISHLAAQQQVSRKFLYQQGQKASEALDATFSSATDEPEVLFYLPITKTWLWQLILALILICHCSYRGVVELLRDVFDLSISVGTIQNRLQSAAQKASAINLTQDLSAIKVGLHDEIFRGNQPVLVGVDASSTYCYLLAAAEHRDEDTWGVHLLDVSKQGLNPDYTIADAAKGLRAGQAAAWPKTPCHGDIFHIQHQAKELVSYLSRRAVAATSHRQKLEQEMLKTKLQGRGHTLSTKLTLARRGELQAVQLANDVKILLQWLSHDVLALAGPAMEERQELFDFIVTELSQRENLLAHRLRPLRTALKNQRDDLLAFAQVLDQKLVEIAQRFDTPLYLVRAVCLLHRKKPSSCAYWQRWNHLHHLLSGKFHLLMAAVNQAL
ncbi:MAG: hypothetical protein JO235_27190 [Chroococcidiopsidaceae cyanobacterium CP_BM_RX_35]|nr:hypothetical protein [Chroococcidiopsidaceae cyanobacterium CP_BM_RX_35]